ncbi:MAG: hypothetical protein ACRCSO_12795 [Sphingomonas sp.]
MPLFRIIVEGTGIRGWNGAAGFFSARSVTQPTQQAAEMQVLRVIREDWRQGPSANLSPTKPALRVIDGWQLGLIERLRRIPDTSYRYYEPGDREAAAQAEAEHSRARPASPLWEIAVIGIDPPAALVRRG